MRKATRQLLNYLKNANPDAELVTVSKLEFSEAEPNKCFENMMRFIDSNESWILRSGWLVGEFYGSNGTAVLPHFWVCNPEDKRDYDITPLEEFQTFEYVLDLEVAKNQDWDRLIGLPVPLKINQDGSLSARTGENTFLPLAKIDYKMLYSLVN